MSSDCEVNSKSVLCEIDLHEYHCLKLIVYPPESVGCSWKLLVDKPNGRRIMLPRSFSLPEIQTIYLEELYITRCNKVNQFVVPIISSFSFSFLS